MQIIQRELGSLGAVVLERYAELLDAVEESQAADSAVAAAAGRHREALSESVRLSRLYSFVAERFVQVLPLAALVNGLLLEGVTFLVARGRITSYNVCYTKLLR